MKYRIDPELKYCPQCQDEYRPEIVECASCSVELLTGKQVLEIEGKKNTRLANRSMEIQPDDELVNILKGPIIDMKQVQSLLRREGYPSIATSDPQSCGKGRCGTDVHLRVRLADAQEILAVLARRHVKTTGLVDHDMSHADAVFNPAAEEATCPACGCCFSTRSNTCPDCGLSFG